MLWPWVVEYNWRLLTKLYACILCPCIWKKKLIISCQKVLNCLLNMWLDLRKGVFHTHPHYIPTLMIHNFRLLKAIELKFGQIEAPTYLNDWRKFQLCISFDNQVMVHQDHRIGCVWKTPFRKSSHIIIIETTEKSRKSMILCTFESSWKTQQ